MGTTEKQTAELDLKDFLSLMDVVDADRRQKNEVEKQLNADEQVADIKARLKATYQTMGETVSDEQLNRAVQSRLSKRWAFQAPAKNLSYRLATWYVDRGRITKRYILPITTVAVGAVAFKSGIEWAGDKLLQQEERRVESKVGDSYAEMQKIKIHLAEIESSPFMPDLPPGEAQAVQALTRSAHNALDDLTKNFFDQYCPNGVADDRITVENMKEAGEKAKASSTSFIEMNDVLQESQKILETHQELLATHQALDGIKEQLLPLQIPSSLASQIEPLYQQGIASVEKRQLGDAKSYLQQLREIKSASEKLVRITPEAERWYAAIKSIAKDPAALEKSGALYSEAKNAITAANVKAAEAAIANLQGLEANVNLAYTVRITGGKWRYPTDNPRAKNFYLLVQAIDENGKPMRRKIVNEENNRTEEVAEWGERVPESAYERVKADKTDDGIIQKNIFAEKKRGYLEEIILFKDQNGALVPRAGKITEW